MNAKKLLSLVFSAAFAVAALAGCGGSDFSREAARAANKAQDTVTFETDANLTKALQKALEDNAGDIRQAVADALGDELGSGDAVDLYTVSAEDAKTAAEAVAASIAKSVAGKQSKGAITMVKADDGAFYAITITTRTGSSGGSGSGSGSGNGSGSGSGTGDDGGTGTTPGGGTGTTPGGGDDDDDDEDNTGTTPGGEGTDPTDPDDGKNPGEGGNEENKPEELPNISENKDNETLNEVLPKLDNIFNEAIENKFKAGTDADIQNALNAALHSAINGGGGSAVVTPGMDALASNFETVINATGKVTSNVNEFFTNTDYQYLTVYYNVVYPSAPTADNLMSFITDANNMGTGVTDSIGLLSNKSGNADDNLEIYIGADIDEVNHEFAYALVIVRKN